VHDKRGHNGNAMEKHPDGDYVTRKAFEHLERQNVALRAKLAKQHPSR